MTVFYLVRHAHSVWKPGELRPLSPSGFQNAEVVADLLASYPITHFYSSPSRRAYQTIAPLAARLDRPISFIADLRERQLSSDFVDDFLAAAKMTWAKPNFAFSGGESNIAAKQRGIVVLESLRVKYPQDHLVLGTHGTLLALILQHFNPTVDFAFWQALTMPDVYALRANAKQVDITRLWPFQENKLPA